MVLSYGVVPGQSAERRPFASRRRFVALADVLGMRNWLSCATPPAIASELDAVLRRADYARVGVGANGRRIGPLVGYVQFSDSTIAYTPDDSWASFWAIMI